MPNYSSPTHKPGTPPTIGVLLVNLGTPEAPTAKGLRPYLRQFLSDPRVIEYPRWLWWLILNGIVLAVRPRKSAKLYQAIWTKDGSPLLTITQSLAAKLQANFGSDNLKIVVAMRYGNPSIQAGLEKLRAANAQRILIVPLFPQYSAATTATIFDVVFDELKKWRWVPELRTITSYHDHPLYIKGMADNIRAFWERNGRSQRLLYSFHGIPQHYADKGDPYPQFCHQTAQLISAELGLSEEETQLCFQSRFGPEEWLQPYTDETLISWPQNGITSVDTVCPGFAVDCLETVEEMGAENKRYFLESGGEAYQYIPCLNDSEAQVALFTALIQQHTRDWAMVDSDPAPPDAKATGYQTTPFQG
jgi:protoporphyrin/coproporphyrin ferrochelatase